MEDIILDSNKRERALKMLSWTAIREGGHGRCYPGQHWEDRHGSSYPGQEKCRVKAIKCFYFIPFVSDTVFRIYGCSGNTELIESNDFV